MKVTSAISPENTKQSMLKKKKMMKDNLPTQVNLFPYK